MIEVGCRGYIPPRFTSYMRQLGFSSSETRKLRDNIQLVTRKCSYIIWINRFNKDFNSALRVSVDGELLPVPTSTPTTTVSSFSQEVKDRISRNRDSALVKLRVNRNRRAALLRLRETRNRKAALLKLQSKKKLVSQQLIHPQILLILRRRSLTLYLVTLLTIQWMGNRSKMSLLSILYGLS